MDLNQYQEQALRSCSPTTPELAGRYNEQLRQMLYMMGQLQASFRIGLVDALKKYIFYGKRSAGMTEDKFFTAASMPIPLSDVPAFSMQHIELVHCILGILSEVEELMEAQEKALKKGEFDTTNIAEELGDIMWYIAQGLRGFGVTMEQAAQRNVDKLRQRYPQKFTEDAAINRDLAAERTILEGGATVEQCMAEIVERAGDNVYIVHEPHPEDRPIVDATVLRAAGELLAECRNRGGIPEIHPAYDNDIPGEDN